MQWLKWRLTLETLQEHFGVCVYVYMQSQYKLDQNIQ